MTELSCHIPSGLADLRDTVTFAALELGVYAFKGVKTPTFDKAMEFAKTIPVVDDFDGIEITEWMVTTEEHYKYMP